MRCNRHRAADLDCQRRIERIRGGKHNKKTVSIFLCIATLLTFVPLTSFAASGNTYYIDSISGSDSATGTSESIAWKTTANIASLKLNAGDKDFFGNPITGNNIGCYGGDGTDAEYQKESLSDKLHRNATDVCNTVVIIIKNEIKRLIKKVIKYFENNF